MISTLIKTGHISADDLECLRKDGAMGDVFSHFFDIKGRICDSSLSGRLIAMPVHLLLKVPYSIGVAGGQLKADAIYGALEGKLINILVTDSKAAEQVLKKT